MIERGARLTLEIEKPAAGGRMLARHAGQVVLVAGTMPGERITARIERVGKGVAFADTEAVIVASPDRRPGSADWRCGGDAFSHIAYPRQLALKAQVIQDAFTRIGRLPLGTTPDVIASPQHGYRMRARLHVQGTRIGFFREGTHDICDAAVSRQLLPATLEWIASAAGTLRSLAETSGGRQQAIKGLELSENAPGTSRAVHLDLHAGANPTAFAGLAEGLVGLSAQAADARMPKVLAGVPAIDDEIDVGGGQRLTLRRSVRAFFQGNRFLLNPLVQHVLSRVGSEAVVDLYAGVGLFGLSLAAAGAQDVTLVEGDPISGADLAGNAEPFADRVVVRQQSVEAFLASATRGSQAPRSARSFRTAAGAPGPKGQVFVVDPPRTGLTREALAGIINHEPSRIVYVSCDVATLARDARTLVDAGWGLAEITGIDLFPNTAHVESIAVFER